MNDLPDLIRAAWARIKPRILANPDELVRRLARRRTPTLTRTPRAWCLAIRASDHRINPATAPIVPEDAAYPHSHVDPELRPYLRHDEHEVTLTAKLLRALARPVYIDPPDERVPIVAERLGVHPNTLMHARRRGRFRIACWPNIYS